MRLIVRPNELTVLYDADCGVCSHVARSLVRADTRGLLRLLSLQSAQLPDMPPRDELLDLLHARDSDGNWFKGGEASVEIARRVPLMRPLAWYARLPMAMPVIDLIYRAVAENRHSISRLLGLKPCRVPARRQ